MIPRPGKKLISCSEHKYDMYTNEFVTKFSPPSLASEFWTGHKSPGKSFAIAATKEVNHDFYEVYIFN